MYKPALLNDPYVSDIVSFFSDTPSFFGRTMKRSNVIENDDNYRIEIAVPGLTKEDIEMNVKDSVLTISYKREESDDKYYFTNSFEKQYSLPSDVNEKGITAKIENGILAATIPKDKKKIKDLVITIE